MKQIFNLNDFSYTTHINLKYGDASFDYNSTQNDLKKIDDYFFEKTKDLNFDYKVYHIYDKALYENIKELLETKKYRLITPHVINSYKMYTENKHKIFVSNEKGQDYLIIQNNCTFYLIEYPDPNNKTSYLMYLFRDIIRTHYENLGGFIFHSAAVVKNQRGIFMTGVGGAGKSTLTFNLISLLDFKFVSNDRTFMTRDNKLTSFPMKIAIGKGTIGNNNLLYDCIKNNEKLISAYSKCFEFYDKVAFIPMELSQSFDMSQHSKENNFDIILFPYFNQNINSIEQVHRKESRKILIEACCSIKDPVWLKPIFKLHKKNKKERCRNALNKIDEILNTKPFYRLNYTKDLDAEKLYELLKKVGFYEKN